jgi:hypothetical protein
LDCHKQIKQHLATDDLHTGAFKNKHCTDCHLDHQGENGLLNHNSAQCAGCHSAIKSVKADTKLNNVNDFSAGHPPFNITLQDGNKTTRLQQDDKNKLIEKPGLKYSHQVHLAKEGISTPQGDTVMQCQDCHKIEESGMHFAPMTMKKTCQQSGCHALDFTDPVEGLAPHGSERAVMDRLRVFYSKWLADSPANRAACMQGTKDCANELAVKSAATTLFRNKPVSTGDKLECGMCHEIEPAGDNDVPWKISLVQINRDWQPGAFFTHSKHGTMNCTECHDKINSKTSSDIAMPTIKKCRECHVGEQKTKGKIRSSCESCHRFHRSEKAAS